MGWHMDLICVLLAPPGHGRGYQTHETALRRLLTSIPNLDSTLPIRDCVTESLRPPVQSVAPYDGSQGRERPRFDHADPAPKNATFLLSIPIPHPHLYLHHKSCRLGDGRETRCSVSGLSHVVEPAIHTKTDSHISASDRLAKPVQQSSVSMYVFA